jgi:formylmethanofuran dehydrogenase subunit E
MPVKRKAVVRQREIMMFKPQIILSILMLSVTAETPVFAKPNPQIQVVDTEFSKGRLGHEQTISLQDAVKLHGHFCDGLVIGFLGLRQVLYSLYPNRIIDRTDLRIASKPAPCLSDVALFLTGARYQYNTFYVSADIKYIYIVQRISTQKVYGVKLKPGTVPESIKTMGNQAIKGELDGCGLDKLKKLEDDLSAKLLAGKPEEFFILEEIQNFKWLPVFRSDFPKTDIFNKGREKCLKK